MCFVYRVPLHPFWNASPFTAFASNSPTRRRSAAPYKPKCSFNGNEGDPSRGIIHAPRQDHGRFRTHLAEGLQPERLGRRCGLFPTRRGAHLDLQKRHRMAGQAQDHIDGQRPGINESGVVRLG